MKLISKGLLAIAATAIVAPVAFGQGMGMGMGMGMGGRLNFADLDTNGDNAISKDELSASHIPKERVDDMFTRWDTNKDGKIDKDEFDNREKPPAQ